VKLLFDENLSRKLVPRLRELFPGCTHVFEVGLMGKSDSEVWAYAQEHELTIVTTDSDFLWKVQAEGPPPKVILLRRWIYPTKDAEDVLRREAIRINEFGLNAEAGALILDKIGFAFPK